ncbi:MAG: hypothetical protein QHH74_04295 [Spirochaetota bacterium]|nr:hypothetical protein [Spirochaetota bacterium]
MKRILSLFTVLSLVIVIAQVWAYIAMDIQKWEIDKKDVITSYIQKLSYKTYTLNQLQGYKNKLLNYILAIDENFKDKIVIIRVTSDITRDFMFINNKLYVITDYMQKSSEDYMSGAIAQLEKKYGVPQKQSEGATTTYTFTRDETKVIAIGEKKGNKYSLTIYYYYKNLFRSLMQ